MRPRRLLIPREHFFQRRAHFLAIALAPRHQIQPPVRLLGHALLRKRAQRSIPRRRNRRPPVQLARRADLALPLQRPALRKQIALLLHRFGRGIQRAQPHQQRLQRRDVLAVVIQYVGKQIHVSGL